MKKNFWISLLSVIVMIMVMRWQGAALVTPQTPRGIIDLEFAGTVDRFRSMRMFIDSNAAMVNLYLDFLFIISYVWFLSSAAKLAERTGFRLIPSEWPVRIAFLAGLLDIGENMLLLDALAAGGTRFTLQLTWWLALIKFTAAGIVVLFLLLAAIVLLFTRKKITDTFEA
ncbi:MAG TPA: hypothetical protein VFZ78_06365 [Flavisolibacter sp.]